jgi:chorismate mutase
MTVPMLIPIETNTSDDNFQEMEQVICQVISTITEDAIATFPALNLMCLKKLNLVSTI